MQYCKKKDFKTVEGRVDLTFASEYDRIPNMTKASAQNKVSVAVLNGVLIRPNSCERCSKQKDIQAHHEDYEKPLVVAWLCRLCHKKRHIELGWGFGV